MIVDVTWDGVTLVKSAQAREDESGGWFVGLEQPMPVGTRLGLSGELDTNVEVVRVLEGAGAGMLLKKAGPHDERATAGARKTTSAATADAKVPAASDGADTKGDKDSDANGGSKKDRRRKRRPSSPGF